MMSTDAKRYYAVLGVDPLASAETIRVAFRGRAKELHPDAQHGDASAFILLKRAYDTLSDPVDRAAYDRFCTPASPPVPPPSSPIDQPVPRPAQYRRQSIPTPPFRRPRPVPRSAAQLGRYVVAFLIMAAISLGGVQAMIMLTEGPPSIQVRQTDKSAEASVAVATPTAEPSPAPGSTKSGFWDATPAPAKQK